MKTILAIIFFAASIGITVFFTIPQYNCNSETCGYDGVKAIRIKKSSYNAALASAQNLESRRDDLTKKYNTVAPEEHQKLEALLPNNVDNIKLVLELETLAKKYGLLIESPKLETKSVETLDLPTNSAGQAIRASGDSSLPSSLPYGTFTLDFTVRATYANAKLLLSDIEHNLRLIEPVSITLKVPGFDPAAATNSNPKAKKYPPGTYDVTIKTVIYYLKN